MNWSLNGLHEMKPNCGKRKKYNIYTPKSYGADSRILCPDGRELYGLRDFERELNKLLEEKEQLKKMIIKGE